MKLYEIKAEFPCGKKEDYSTKANNYNQAIKNLKNKFGNTWPVDWYSTVLFQCYRVR